MEYSKLIDEYKQEMLKMLKELIEIKSVQAKPAEGAPFGKEIAEALNYMLGRAEKEGFDVENINNFGGHIEFGGYTLDENDEVVGTSDEIMGVLTHLDVMPAGEDWNYSPFEVTIEAERIYGRGTIDNKGAVVSAFYAMKALRDSGYTPEKKVRLILGLDEETDMKGMEHYLAKAKAPTFGFTPDSWYPMVNGEKGILVFQLAKKIGKTTGKGVELRSLKGGNTTNEVPDYARAVIRSDKTAVYESIKALAATYRKEMCDNEQQQAYGARINCKGIGKSLEIVAQGIAAHGATPELGVNAITVLLDFLGRLDMINDDINEFVKFYNAHIGFEVDGRSMGCGISDDASGTLAFNPGQIELDGGAIILGVSVRFPVTFEDKGVYDSMQEIINRYNMGIIKIKSQAPVYTSLDEPWVKTLMDIYREHTGDNDSQPMVIGGATYARVVKNIVGFGPSFPKQPYTAHKKNEYIEIENLILNAKIFADAIYRLSH